MKNINAALKNKDLKKHLVDKVDNIINNIRKKIKDAKYIP